MAAGYSFPSWALLPLGVTGSSAALAALRVRQGRLDLLDGIDLLDRSGEDALQDLLTEIGVDGSDLGERAPGQGAAQMKPTDV